MKCREAKREQRKKSSLIVEPCLHCCLYWCPRLEGNDSKDSRASLPNGEWRPLGSARRPQAQTNRISCASFWSWRCSNNICMFVWKASIDGERTWVSSKGGTSSGLKTIGPSRLSKILSTDVGILPPLAFGTPLSLYHMYRRIAQGDYHQ